MRRTHIGPIMIAALAALLLGVALTVAGCGSGPVAKKKVTPIPVTTPTAEATAGAAADAAFAESAGVSTGPISKLDANSAVTAKLAVGARAYLKTTSKFTINQLFLQGDVAVGDITPKSGGSRVFIAWVGPSWKTVWTAPMGQGGSTLARAAVPQMSKDLAAKMDWNPKVAAASASAGTAGGADISALQASFTAYVKSAMTSYVGGPDVAGAVSASDVRVVPDNKGVYWGSALAEASSGGDAVSFYAKYVGGKWVGQGNSDEGVLPGDSKFPAEVQGLL